MCLQMNDSVFLVEDEPLVAMEIQDLIEEVGLKADGPYATVARAQSALLESTPSCAVLDVRLRDGEIFPVADELQARGIPIIFHSGHASPRQLLDRYPGATVCEKPCSPSLLVRAIEQATSADRQVA